MEPSARIYVAGGDTLAGAAILRQLGRRGFRNLCEAEPDLTRRDDVDRFFARERPEYVFLAAGASGGIAANRSRPADLMLDNLLVVAHVLDTAHRHGVRKLLYLASSCCYPRACPQPMHVEHLMTGPLEPTNEAYATAKLAGIKLCQAYRQQTRTSFVVGIPANIYGPGDDFEPETAHVIGALMRRMHEAGNNGANSVTIWGTGTPRREFLFADDLASACLAVMDRYDSDSPINLGSGQACSIRELAELIRNVVDYPGQLVFDPSRPDGMPCKALDCQPLHDLGWRATMNLEDGLRATWRWFVERLRPTR